MKEYKLIDCLPSTLSNQFDFVVSYDDESYTVFDTNFFITEIYEHFSDRQIRLADTLPDVALKGLFDMWAASRNDNYARRMYALSIDYNPLENYDRMEDQEHSDETTHGETITRTLANNDTESYTNYKETNKRTGSVENTSGVYGSNSANNVPSDVAQTRITISRMKRAIPDPKRTHTPARSRMRTPAAPVHPASILSGHMVTSAPQLVHRCWRRISAFSGKISR
jgi:hypothetical protein